MNHEIQDRTPSFFPKSPTQPGKNNPDLVGNTFIRFIYPGDCDSKVSHHPCIDPRDDTASAKTLGKTWRSSNWFVFHFILLTAFVCGLGRAVPAEERSNRCSVLINNIANKSPGVSRRDVVDPHYYFDENCRLLGKRIHGDWSSCVRDLFPAFYGIWNIIERYITKPPSK